jgi:hypothetical protein
MAITHIIEKLSGNSLSLALPIYVYDDGDPPAAITRDQLVAYLNSQYGTGIPSTVLGVPDDGDPHIQQLSRSSWRATIRYKVLTMRPVQPAAVGTKRSSFDFVPRRKYVEFAPEIAKFPSSTPTMGGCVNYQFDFTTGASSRGTWLEPPPVSLTTEQSFAPATVTVNAVRALALVVQAGAVNSDSLGSGVYLPGEMMIGYCHGSQITNGVFQIVTGWCWQRNVTGETRGPVSGIAYRGHDFTWNLFEQNCDRNAILFPVKVRAVYVNQVRPMVPFSGLLVSPP